MNAVLDVVEPALCHAREALCGPRDQPGLQRAHRALRAARDFLELHRRPEHGEYETLRMVQSAIRGTADAAHVFEGSPVQSCIGDSRQVQIILSRLVRHTVLEGNAVLLVSLYEAGDVPRVRLTIDGPGHIPETLSFDGMCFCSMSTLAEIWTSASRGGRIDSHVHGVELRLKGVRALPANEWPCESVLVPVRHAEELLRILTGDPAASPQDETLAAARESLDRALCAIDAEGRKPEPANVAAVLAQVIETIHCETQRAALSVETLHSQQIPPIVVCRNRLHAFFTNALRHAMAVLPHGGSALVLLDYRAQARCVQIECALTGERDTGVETPYVASMRRAVVDVHGGVFAVDADASSYSLCAELPDPTAKELDAWTPGWERFTERSKQALRLLKSGGPVPQEEFLLGAVLEEELEDWLLPKLTVAPAPNLASALRPGVSNLPGASSERLAKALAQIARGKPKKEICRPVYAAELLWAFRFDERHRRAIGSQRLDESQLRTLCEELLKPAPDCTACLRLIAIAKGESPR